MKALITGANGFIARHVIDDLLHAGNMQVTGTAKTSAPFPYPAHPGFSFYPLDITDGDAVEKCFTSVMPDVIIHAAALSQPNYCELNKEECIKVNVEGTKHIVRVAKAMKAYLLFLSTDFVFSGQNGPYREDDEVGPVNHYGWSKVLAERLCADSGPGFSIVRLCSVYGRALTGQNRNVVMWVKQSLSRNVHIQVVDDQFRSPTYVRDVATGIIKIARQMLPGIYHIAGAEILTPYDMAIQTAAFFGLDETLIERVSSATFTEPAKRPPFTGLIIEKATRVFDFAPVGFIHALQKMRAEGL